MTKTEKIMIVGIVACLFMFFASLYVVRTSIEKAGGVKGIAVAVGKEIKDIKKKIDSE